MTFLLSFKLYLRKETLSRPNPLWSLPSTISESETLRKKGVGGFREQITTTRKCKTHTETYILHRLTGTPYPNKVKGFVKAVDG